MPISASLQLALPFELVNELDVAKQVPHLLMMLLTAFSHIGDDVDNDDIDEIDDGQPVTNNRPNTTAAEARFMADPRGKVMSPSIVPNRRKIRHSKWPWNSRRRRLLAAYFGPAPD